MHFSLEFFILPHICLLCTIYTYAMYYMSKKSIKHSIHIQNAFITYLPLG